MKILYRDDDVNVHTDFWLFRQINEVFKKVGKDHTIAILMKDFRENYAVWKYITSEPNIVVGLHGWEHKDYSKMPRDEVYYDLKKALDYYKENLTRMYQKKYEDFPANKRIDTFFAPWNRESEIVRSVCGRLGLKFCNVSQGEWDGKDVASFHWWSAYRFSGDKLHVVLPKFGEITSL